MQDAAAQARRMWMLFEPVHAVIYFSAEGLSAFEQAGLRGFWRGYFAGRAAPLGPVGPAPVTASFFNFAPAMVEQALPAVWELISPADAVTVRSSGAAAALQRLTGDAGSSAPSADITVAADLLMKAVDGIDCSGRVLAAANAALPVPSEPLARLWHAATLLREHRGEGHFAALVAAGIDGCEAVVLRAGQDMDRAQLQPLRRWTDEEWDAAAARLARRGWLDSEGRITQEGTDARRAVEAATDLAAARPWARLGPAGTNELIALLTPAARVCAAEQPARSPSGLPERA